MKLVMGSVKLGMNYGLFNKKKICYREFKKIEKLVLKSKIKFIDTASSYGDSEKVIGKSRLKKLNIITKIKLPRNKDVNLKKWIFNKVNISLNRLKINKIYGVLVHNTRDLSKKNKKIFITCLQELKKKKIISKIGISIYNPNDIKKIWEFWKPDLVQVPFNPIDNRILVSGWLKKLKKFKVEIYVRSIFLKGLLINDYSTFKFNKESKSILDKFAKWCFINNISRKEACLQFARQFKYIDFLVVGFNSYIHLKEIINFLKKKQIVIPRIFSTNNLNLVDPRRWKLKKKH